MILHVVGVAHQKGEFVPTGSNRTVPYDNHVLHGYWIDLTKDNLEGYEVSKEKVKTDYYNNILAKYNISTLKGHDIELLYDKNATLVQTKLIK